MASVTNTLYGMQHQIHKASYENKVCQEDIRNAELNRIEELYNQMADCHNTQGGLELIRAFAAIVGIAGACFGVNDTTGRTISAVSTTLDRGGELLKACYASQPEMVRGLLEITRNLLQQENSGERDTVEMGRELERMLKEVIDNAEQAKSKTMQRH